MFEDVCITDVNSERHKLAVVKLDKSATWETTRTKGKFIVIQNFYFLNDTDLSSIY